jgi:hypothetical protein
MIDPPRSLEQRTADVLARLRGDVDLWIASADADGNAYLLPLSFVWDGAALTVATPRASRTARNLMRARRARVALGLTRDVVMLDGVVEAIAIGADPAPEDAHAAPRRASTRERSARSTSICGSRLARSRPGGRPTSCPAGR